MSAMPIAPIRKPARVERGVGAPDRRAGHVDERFAVERRADGGEPGDAEEEHAARAQPVGELAAEQREGGDRDRVAGQDERQHAAARGREVRAHVGERQVGARDRERHHRHGGDGHDEGHPPRSLGACAVDGSPVDRRGHSASPTGAPSTIWSRYSLMP
jgi:hypothetical protein